MKLKTTAILAALALAATGAQAQKTSQGVSKDEILLGSIQDLSGPLAGFGKQARLGMMLRVDEINEQGGINGRKLKLIIEDSGYDPKKAVLAAQKLVNQDKIFMMVGHLGTAQNLAAMPVQFEKNVINFFPITAAREMYEPFHRLKYSFAATYYDQMRNAVPKLVKEKGAKKVCTMYQDDEFGLEVKRGAEAGLKTINMAYCRRDHLQTRRHRLLLPGAEDAGRWLRHGGAGHHHPRDHWRHRNRAQARLQPDLPGIQRSLHRPDPQARRPRHERSVRDQHGAEPLHRLVLAADPFLGHQVPDQVQRGAHGVLGLWLHHHRHLRQGRRQGRCRI